jgi:hypothetical protein
MTDSYTFGTRGKGLRVSEQELKNQLDRERLSNNPSAFFGTNQFSDNSGSSTVENTPNQNVNVLEGGRGGTNTSTDQYGRDFDDPEFGQPLVTTDNKQSTEQTEVEGKKEGNKFSIKKDTFGKYSTRRRGGVLRYPMELMTQETDYLQIDIQKYVALGNYLSRPGANTRYVTGNNFSNRAGRRTANNLTTKPLINDGTILLPIPSDLKDVNSVKYDTSTLNGLQAVGAAAVEGGSKAFSDLVGSLFPGGNENNERQSAVDELGNVAKTAFGDVIGGVGSEAAATNFLRKRFASQIVGMFGGNVTASQLLARGNGEIINPNMELLFGGPTLRNFRFQFKMTPRNEKEAEQIKLIIRAFKRNMAPMAQGGTLGSGFFFLKTPNVFNLRYRTGNKNHPFLNRFKQCFLTDMSVSYTGEGIYSTYEDGTPVSMILDLSFKETQPIYDVDYDERPGTEAVGY